MGAHLIDGEFQSDKYPECPRGKVPLSVRDKSAQPLLWQYAQSHRAIDAEFSDDLETALIAAGYSGPERPEQLTPFTITTPKGVYSSGVTEIFKARTHQIYGEGFTPERDARYEDDELLRAALWFLTGNDQHCPWPGTRHTPGKRDRIGDLAKAGALIAAEIDRQRLTGKPDR